VTEQQDNISKGRKRVRRRLGALEALHSNQDHPVPGHEAAADANAIADGYTDGMHQATPDECKNLSHGVPTSTSDIGDRYRPDDSHYRANGAAQMAESATQRAARGNPASVPDFNAERAGSSPRVAVDHPDLRQSDTDFSQVLSRLATRRGNVQDLNLPESVPGGFSHAGSVALNFFDGANQAGAVHGLRDPLNPDPYRPADHPSRTSATPDNGGHASGSQQGACSTPRDSMKASDRLAIMKATMRQA
jgi:hypothetical protein